MSPRSGTLKKIGEVFNQIRTGLNKDKFSSVNLMMMDESRFGLMTYIGRCITAFGVKPVAPFRQGFKNTYLYGAFSPVDGDMFTMEVEGTTSDIFYVFLEELSMHRPDEFKVLIIDNAAFHSLKGRELPPNIALVNIPPYAPELNPAERVWQYMKQYFKNRVFDDLEDVKNWIANFVKEKLSADTVKSIVHNKLTWKIIYVI